MQTYKEIIQSIGIECGFLYTDEGSSVTANVQTHQRRSRASPVRTLIVFLPIFQIGPKTFNIMRLFVRYDTEASDVS